MPGLIRTSAIALAGGVMLLTGCQSSAGAGSAAGTPSSSADASAGAAVQADAPAPAASPSSSPAGPPTPSHGSATPARATDQAPAATSHPPTAVAGCRNLAAGDAVKAAVTRVYRHDVTHFTHIEPVPHVFFYGQCGTVRYAATRFGLTAGATQPELVGMQDEGSAIKYFRSSGGGGWVYVASDGFPAGPHGCADIPAIPDALATAWGNCSLGH
ncbi:MULTISPECIES: hypothetical protein [unclassified Streptomyces]|uniref:hypothetical protein n=1 Tax=unclassified Streptomyces TaxID=2593676 RepID=UPI0033AD98F2